MGNCKHGLLEGSCALCNNNGFEIKREKRTITIDPIEREYKDKEYRFKDKKDIWTKDEIELVYDEFKCINKKKQFKRKVYEVALVLERTQLAVRWMIKHVFSKREDLHRGLEVIMFRRERGL